MSNEIIKAPQAQTLVTSVKDLQDIAQVFVKSGFFADTADLAKTQVKIMAGREIGLEPFASMSGIHVIKGKVTYGANVMAAKVKGSGRYDYRVREMTDKACRIMFMQFVSGKWEEVGLSEFTIEDARKAGTQNTDRFPRNMLFARAISNGVKWFCPDVTSGVTMYAPEEFGAVVDDSGKVVEVDGQAVVEGHAVDEPAAPIAQPAAEQPKAEAPKSQPEPTGTFDGMITPTLLVEAGLSESVPAAAQLINKLHIAGKPAAEFIPLVRLYRAHRDAGKDSDTAAASALAGEQP